MNTMSYRAEMRHPGYKYVCGALFAALLLLVGGPAFGASTANTAIEIQNLELRETATGAELTLQGSGPIVWTQYRNDLGDLVVELPNTILAGEVLPPAPRGLVSAVVLQPEDGGARPMTRMVISTNTEAEHTLYGNEEGLLTLTFGVPAKNQVASSSLGSEPSATSEQEPAVGEAIARTASVGSAFESAALEPAPLEPLSTGFTPEPSLPESSVAASANPEPSYSEPITAESTVAVAAVAVAGTPEEPIAGPAPSGVRATKLLGVEIVDLDGTPALKIQGDGEFVYSTFRLENPPRFVIDLMGVVNSANSTQEIIDGDHVERVRMAQFRPYPDPVSRVVLDLVGEAMPLLDGAGDGLWVRFARAEDLITDSTAVDEESQAPADDYSVDSTEDDTAQAAASSTATVVPALSEAAEVGTEAVQPEPMEVAELEPRPEVSEPPAEIATSEPLYAEEETPADTAPVFADDDFEPEDLGEEPLQIADDTRSEVRVSPPVNDVSLFEAQQADRQPNDVRRNETAQGFAVQRLDTESKFVGRPITLAVKDADLSEVLRTIARYADLNLVVQPGISAPVTVEFIAVPWDQALDAILKINRLDKQLEGNILRIAQKDLFRQEAVEDQELAQARALSVPLSTVIKRLSYAEANAVSQILTRGQRTQGGGGSRVAGSRFQDTGILSRRGSVNVDLRTNTLIIKELPSYLDTVLQVIENLDIPEKQVMIEARIVETTRNFSRSLGIDWSFGGAATAATGNTTGLQFPNRIETGGGVQLLTGGDNGFFNLSLGNVLNTLQIDLALQAAENEGLINVISSPKIATLNNNPAEIETGLQLPVQTVVGGGGALAGGGANPFGTVSVNFVRASLRLQVTPQVTFEGTILMRVQIEKDEPQFALQVPGAPTAPIATRRASTRVRVADGGTAVIGGIYQVTANEGEGRVPGLARIPVLGQLFKNRNKSNQNQELLIFITPRVIQQ